MKCKRCGNEDAEYFYKGHKGYYCRKCIKFSRLLLDEDIKPYEYDVNYDADEYNLSFELTSAQKQISDKCLQYIQKGDVLLHCVCGSGKTEIVVKTISYYLSKGLKVAYAISRREVVIELSKRFKQIFTNGNVVAVYGGHHDLLNGDLIVCTTHQLFRYYQTFDLLIIDEVDGFPLKGNKTLMNISINSCKGNIIYSTATIDKCLLDVINKRKYYKLELFVRPSYKPLVIPKVVYLFKYMHFLYLNYLLRNMTNQCIIFVSSKKLCVSLYKIFSKLYSCTYVYADLDVRDKNITAFKNKEYKFIFATTVLERGITIKNINVIVVSFSKTFDEANYVQMLGRVGRDIDNPTGEAYILLNHFDKSVNDCVNYLKLANSYL